MANTKNDVDELIEFEVEGESSSELVAGCEADETVVDSETHADETASDSVDDDDDVSHAIDDAADGTDDERAAIRERRRQERLEQKTRRREREEQTRRELSAKDAKITQLSQRLDEIERRSTNGDLAHISNSKLKAAEAYKHYKDQIRVGTESGNGTLVADATERMILAKGKFEELARLEDAVKTKSNTPQPLDTRVAQNAKAWTDANTWYDPRGKDQDSRVVLSIDQALAEEGWDPTTSDYWKELSIRTKKYLPHREKRDNIQRNVRNVVAGSGRETSLQKPGGSFKLSSERVKALKEMGVWDDPIQRNKMIKQYRDYDKSNEGAR